MELTADVIRELMNKDSKSRKITIYITTQPKSTSQSISEDTIRYKNALQDIEDEVRTANDGLHKTFKMLRDLIDDTPFWKHQTAGLAVFADDKGYRTIHLPYAPTEFSRVDDIYYVSPLLAMESVGLKYYLLYVDLQTPKLYSGSEYNLRTVEDIDMPEPMEDELGVEQRKKTMQFRSGDANGNALFYGHGDVDERQPKLVEKYLRLIAERTDEYLQDENTGAPLLLCGIERRVSQIRPMLKYSQILDTSMPVNPEDITNPKLHESSYEIVANAAHEARQAIVGRYNEAPFEVKADGKAGVLAAANRGAVDVLVLPVIRRMGEPAMGAISTKQIVPPEDMATFESAVRAVVKQGGSVQAVEMDAFPGNPSMKALLRF